MEAPQTEGMIDVLADILDRVKLFRELADATKALLNACESLDVPYQSRAYAQAKAVVARIEAKP